jgi:hypothetical protein
LNPNETTPLEGKAINILKRELIKTLDKSKIIIKQKNPDFSGF